MNSESPEDTQVALDELAATPNEDIQVWAVEIRETREAACTVMMEAPTKEEAERYAKDLQAEGSFLSAHDFETIDDDIENVYPVNNQAEYFWEDYLG